MQFIHQYLAEGARQHADKTAIASGEKTLSYADLIGKINTAAEMFIVEGLRKGDRVLLLLRDQVELAVGCYAVIRAGGVAVPIKESEEIATIQLIARNCAPTMFVTSRSDLRLSPAVRDILSCPFFFVEEMSSHSSVSESPALQYLHSGEGVDRISQLMSLQTTDGAMISYSAPPSDYSAGLLFTHENLLQTVQNILSPELITPETRELMMLPLRQCYGFARLTALLSCGATVILDEGSSASVNVMNILLRERSNALALSPSAFSALIREGELFSRRIGDQLGIITIESDLLPSIHRQKIFDLFPKTNFVISYGTPEAPCSAFITIHNGQNKGNFPAQKVPGIELSVSDERGNLLAAGQTGEILVRGNHVTAGYWRNAELTRSSFQRGNWLRTGTIGYLDTDGHLNILGRRDEIIHSSGMKISPAEVEEHIHNAYPEYEICVVGIPDPTELVGEIPVLCYIGKNGKTIIPSELSSELSTRLEKYKIPRIVYRVDEFPHVDRKILRSELRKRLMEGMAPVIVQSSTS